MRILFQTQLSNFINGKVGLAQDSGWQMCVGRIREMLKLSPDLKIDITGPRLEQLVEGPAKINPDLFTKDDRVIYKAHRVIPNALATRYDFNIDEMDSVLELTCNKQYTHMRYDVVYVNDPLLLRHYKALFFLRAGYMPRFVVHSHFVDCVSSPKFPIEVSLWLGQLEACQRADYNFWQCQTALNQFEEDARKLLKDEVVDEIMKKSSSYDDGYSIAEITSPINYDNIRFNIDAFLKATENKIITLFPNRLSRASQDYTNGIKLLDELLPQMYSRRQDFVLVCGNPNMKMTNDELNEKYAKFGYLKVGDNAFNRDEFKFIASHTNVSLHLYCQDTYGGTAMRECVELGCAPLFTDINEQESIANLAWWPHTCNPDFSNFICVFDALCNTVHDQDEMHKINMSNLQNVIRQRCSYESTTKDAMKIMGIPMIDPTNSFAHKEQDIKMMSK